MSNFSFSADKINNIIFYMGDASKELGNYIDDLNDVLGMLADTVLPGKESCFYYVWAARKALSAKIRKAEDLKKNCESFAKSLEAFKTYAVKVDADAAKAIADISTTKYAGTDFNTVSQNTYDMISKVIDDPSGYAWTALLESISADRRTFEAKADPFNDDLRNVLKRHEHELFEYKNAKDWHDDIVDRNFGFYLAKTEILGLLDILALGDGVALFSQAIGTPSTVIGAGEQYLKYEALQKADLLRADGHWIAAEYFSEIKDLKSYDSHHDYGDAEANGWTGSTTTYIKDRLALISWVKTLISLKDLNLFKDPSKAGSAADTLSESEQIFKDFMDDVKDVRNAGSLSEAVLKLVDLIQDKSTDPKSYAKTIWKIIKKTPGLKDLLSDLSKSDIPVLNDASSAVDQVLGGWDFITSVEDAEKAAPENEFKAKMDEISELRSPENIEKMRALWNDIVVPLGQYSANDFNSFMPEDACDIIGGAALITTFGSNSN